MKAVVRTYMPRFSGPLLVAAMLVVCLVVGCAYKPDPRLAEADALMESHPDSALTLLNDYRLSPASSKGDSAYYGLLLTHARYKNFIDETDDSLISRSVDYFLASGDKERAARALFLQGMIRLNAQRLGEAAVSFTQGLDLARECRAYMWEGQCARGLCILNGKVCDGSAQVDYAEQALTAFQKTADKGWIDYSLLTLATALTNNSRYEESQVIAGDLLENGAFVDDPLLMSELYRLKGLSLFAMGRLAESLDSYVTAHAINHNCLRDGDIRNMQVAVSELSKQDSSITSKSLVGDLDVIETPKDAYVVYADKGEYKQAYESLQVYKNRQDSVLSVIFSNNVSESIEQYKSLRFALLDERHKRERLSYWIIILVLVVGAIGVLLRFREQLHRKETARLRTEAAMESLRSDLLSQLEVVKGDMQKSPIPAEQQASDDFERIIRQRYAEANRLCDDYYQGGQLLKTKSGGAHEEVQNIVKGLTEKESLDKIAEYVDEKSGGLYSSFKKDFYILPNDSHRLFLYLMLGFSPRTLSVIFGQNLTSIYTKKSRLKTKIERSETSLKNEYMNFF